MRRASLSQSLVAGTVILAMTASITGLFGASGASIKITSPAAGARVSGVVQVTAALRNAPRTAYVIIGVDGERPYSTNTAPYVFELDSSALSDGPHLIFVEAYDTYGLIASSKPITINVKNGAAPVVQARRETPKAAATRSVAKTDLTPATAASPEEARTARATSASLAARGPIPEPGRAAAAARIAPSSPTAPEASRRASFASATAQETPPAPSALPARPRGHTVVMNGRAVQFEVTPSVEAGRLQVGFRAMFETAGARVSWHPGTRTARSVGGQSTVEVTNGSPLARLNGQPVEMETAATIRESRMIVPLRFFARATGAALYWDSETRMALVQTTERVLAERTAE